MKSAPKLLQRFRIPFFLSLSFVTSLSVLRILTPFVEKIPNTAAAGARSGVKEASNVSFGKSLLEKESDRKNGILNLCRSFGADFIEEKDTVYIKKGYSVDTPSELFFDDHRMIMAGIVAGIASGKSVIHNNVENIAKSYPQFLDTIQSIGAEVQYL